jgi:hypothetical protein
LPDPDPGTALFACEQCSIYRGWKTEIFNERKVREREIDGERKGCYNKFIQDPDSESEPKLPEKSDLDPQH